MNVVLYAPGGGRWTMTERGRGALDRGARHLAIGPSALQWDGQTLSIDVDEVAVPWPRRVRGRIRVRPSALTRTDFVLDGAGAHRWSPLAPSSRIEIEMNQPSVRWQGSAYLDSNEGDAPLAEAFDDWDWMRVPLGPRGADGTAIVYDTRARGGGPSRIVAQRFGRDGTAEPLSLGPRHSLPSTGWRIARGARGEPGGALPRVVRTLEDTPFYARTLLEVGIAGERATAVHETLDARRLHHAIVRAMLPFRMPRRGG